MREKRQLYRIPTNKYGRNKETERREKPQGRRKKNLGLFNVIMIGGL